MPSPFQDTISDNIARAGFQVFGIFPVESEDPPPFAYSVGLTEREWPELFVVGPAPQIGHAIISQIVERYEDLSVVPTAGDKLNGVIKGFPLRLEAVVRVPKLDDMLTQADAYYDRPVKALQIVWPDSNGNWPENPAFSTDLVGVQDHWKR